jgi:hypothetical protein
MPLQIEIDEGREAFEPGGKLAVTATWQLAKPPRGVELRLFWFTRGRGSEDAGVVETVRFDGPKAEDKRSFRLRLPEGPCSFSGQLISLIWALELVAEPSKETARVEIVMAPGGQAVQLDALPKWESGG